MAANKHISKIIIAVMAAAAVLCLLAVAFSGRLTTLLGGTGVTMEYESKLFDTDEVISIDIRMDEDEWNKMLENAMSEEYYVCDVVINGTEFHDVGIRPKGNTSLSSIAMDPDSDRFSLKLEFDQFVDGQTCFGLDKLILNNNYADATNMKEALIYDMFQYIGADASLYNYASISLNGENKGVYLALEGVEDSFMLRNFGTQAGELYKPETMGMGGGGSDMGSKPSMGGGFKGRGSGSVSGNGGPPSGDFPGGDFDPDNMPDFGDFDPDNMPDFGDFDPENMPEMGDFDPGNMPDRKDTVSGADSVSGPNSGGGPGGGGGFSMGGKGGANLNYSDDDLDSYSTIWEGEITGTGTADHRRVVTALKNISEGNDIEKYLDVDNVLKYMAVHAFAVNQDSLSGMMAHNYYLYEYNGQLNIFPWDYNLSLGGMSMGRDADGTSMVNDAIDTPFDGTDFFDALLENEEYLEIYHSYLRKLAEEYVEGGRFDEVYTRIMDQISPLVAEDPTAFYSKEEFDEAAQMLYETVKLRAESIKGQLDGSIPSTDEGQKADPSSLIDASDIDVTVMGQMNMGGGGDDNGDNGVKPHKGKRSVSGNQPPGFAGMPGQTDSGDQLRYLIRYGILFALMIIVLLVFSSLRRRK